MRRTLLTRFDSTNDGTGWYWSVSTIPQIQTGQWVRVVQEAGWAATLISARFQAMLARRRITRMK